MSTELTMWEDSQKLAEIKKMYGGNLSPAQWTVFLEYGKSTGLNPFTREIYAIAYGNQCNIFIGRDGYRKMAQRNPDYDYHQADAVYSNDDFRIENGEVRHSYTLNDRGRLVGAYGIAKRLNSSKPVFTYVEFVEYYQGNKNPDGSIKKTSKGYPMKPTVWDEKPATMIKKVAEAQVLRMCWQELFAGTYEESEDWNKNRENLASVQQRDGSSEPSDLAAIPQVASIDDLTEMQSSLAEEDMADVAREMFEAPTEKQSKYLHDLLAQFYRIQGVAAHQQDETYTAIYKKVIGKDDPSSITKDECKIMIERLKDKIEELKD